MGLGRGAGLGKQSKTTALFSTSVPTSAPAPPLTLPTQHTVLLPSGKQRTGGLCPGRSWALMQPGVMQLSSGFCVTLGGRFPLGHILLSTGRLTRPGERRKPFQRAWPRLQRWCQLCGSWHQKPGEPLISHFTGRKGRRVSSQLDCGCWASATAG